MISILKILTKGGGSKIPKIKLMLFVLGLPKKFLNFFWYSGASIKYVCTEGGRGFKNWLILQTNNTGHADEGGGGSKIPKIIRTYLMEAPSQYMIFFICEILLAGALFPL